MIRGTTQLAWLSPRMCRQCHVTQYHVLCIAGTEEERGLKLWKENLKRSSSVNQAEASSYDLPLGMALIRKCRWAHRVPFSPTFGIGQSGKVTDQRAEEKDHYVAEQLDVPTIIDGTLVSEKGNDNIAYNDFNSDVVTKM